MTHLRSAVFLVLVLVLPWALHAQAISMGGGSNDDVPRLEFGANYNFFHANAPPGQCGCFSMNGGSGTVVYNITPKWAAVADLTIGHATNVDNSLQNITIFNYLFLALATLVATQAALFHTDKHCLAGQRRTSTSSSQLTGNRSAS